MKIEMGESLFYSWLRHVKECQIVQTNWKVSSQWQLSNAEELEKMMRTVDSHYSGKYGYAIFKQNASLSQLLQQGECDVLGVCIQPDEIKYYAIDVAFHEAGLNYGTRETTVMKVLEKCARTAFCLHGYLNTKDAEIIFASPKINPAVLNDLAPCIKEMNDLFANEGYEFTFRIIANEDYNDLVLKPILLASDGVADTSELFLRSYQMYKMFAGIPTERRTRATTTTSRTRTASVDVDYMDSDVYQELKIGQLAQKVLGPMLVDGCASDEEVAAMQTFEYSKETFDIQYPLLKLATESQTPLHYYATPILVNGQRYRLCNEWHEKGSNNDRPYLLKWIALHK